MCNKFIGAERAVKIGFKLKLQIWLYHVYIILGYLFHYLYSKLQNQLVVLRYHGIYRYSSITGFWYYSIPIRILQYRYPISILSTQTYMLLLFTSILYYYCNLYSTMCLADNREAAVSEFLKGWWIGDG